MSWYGWVIAIFVFDILVGLLVWWIVDECSDHLFDAKEVVALLIFWPILGLILGLILGIMGIMSLVIKAYKNLEEDMEDR